MKELVCKNCGASGLRIKNSYAICTYCDSKYLLTADDFGIYGSVNASHSGRPESVSTNISIDDDIECLLKKCRTNPRNARKYANLILDIDPDNEEALSYL